MSEAARYGSQIEQFVEGVILQRTEGGESEKIKKVTLESLHGDRIAGESTKANPGDFGCLPGGGL